MRARIRWADQTPVIIVVLMIVIFGVLAGEYFLTPRNFENVLRQVSLDAPIVFGQTLVLIAGGIDLSVGSNMAMSAALAIGLQPALGTGLAVLTALGFGTLVGLVNGLLVTKGRIVPFIATLGTMTVLRGLLLTYTQQQPISGSDPEFVWWGSGSVGFIPVPTLVTLVLLVLLTLFLRSTRPGRNLFAIGGNREAAELAGIPIERFVILAFVGSGFLAGVSGVLVAARINSANVQLGLDTPLLSIAAAIIGGASLLGGRGRMGGSLLGVLALGLLTNGMNLVGIMTHYQIAIRATILISVVAIDAFTRNMSTRLHRRLGTSG